MLEDNNEIFFEYEKITRNVFDTKKYIYIICACIIISIISIIIIIGVNKQNMKLVNMQKENTNIGSESQNTNNSSKNIINEDKQRRLSPGKYPQYSMNFEQEIDKIYYGEQKVAYLTFDDGPSKSVTPEVLKVLKEEQVPATFFVLGKNVKKYPEIIKEIHKRGHYIANHSYTHEYSELYESVDSVLKEVENTEKELKKVLGTEYNTHLFRFPGGSHGGYYQGIKTKAKAKLKEKRIYSLNWNCLTGDAEGYNSVESQLEQFEETRKEDIGLIVLLHDLGNKESTPETTKKIIQKLKKEGYVFKNFYEIFKPK